MEQNILSVSELNSYLKFLFDRDEHLTSLAVRGEISNYKIYPSGHHYFTLKDEGGALRCVMFKNSALRLRFRPENGMKVIAAGRVSVFPRDGAYQLYCDALTPDGVGDLYVAFEQLKQKLQAEGLFDPAHKKPLPPYPKTIAIVTSGAGAAVMDMLRILNRRYPLVKVKLLPVRVQGAEAPAEIAGAIRYANRYHVADLIITGRGGGSIEDLWAFNDERVARAIYDSELPVISAVGHEPDVTISDFVADVRAATPSNAAELAVPDQMELRARLLSQRTHLGQMMMRQLQLLRQQLTSLAKKRVLQSPENYLEDKRLALDHAQQRLAALAQKSVADRQRQFVQLAARLDAMSPLKVLSRGYSVARTQTGEILRDARQVQKRQEIELQLYRGRVTAQVMDTKEETDESGTDEL